MVKSKRTKTCGFWRIIFKILSVFCFIIPLAVFAGVALAEGVLAVEAFSIAASVIVTGIISLVCIVNKTVMRSKIWIFIIVLYLVLEHFLPVLLVVSICQIMDELIFTPLYNHFRTLYLANKEIDRRP